LDNMKSGSEMQFSLWISVLNLYVERYTLET